MALIIPLNREAAATEIEVASASAEPDAGSTAEVILFPGVRYEHWVDGPRNSDAPQASMGATPSAVAPRDWLEI